MRRLVGTTICAPRPALRAPAREAVRWRAENLAAAEESIARRVHRGRREAARPARPAAVRSTRARAATQPNDATMTWGGPDENLLPDWEAFQTDDLATALERGTGDGGALLLSGINGGVASSCLVLVLVLVCGLWLYGAKYACPSLLKKKLQAVNVARMRQVRAHSPILAMWIAQSFSQTGLLSLRPHLSRALRASRRSTLGRRLGQS